MDVLNKSSFNNANGYFLVVGLAGAVPDDVNALIWKFIGFKPHPLARLLKPYFWCSFSFSSGLILSNIRCDKIVERYCKLCHRDYHSKVSYHRNYKTFFRVGRRRV